MIRTLVLAFSLTGSLFGSADPLPDQKEIAPATLELHISAKEASLILGQQPHITATIINKGKASVTLVLPGDGSECGWRTPLVGFSSVKIDKGNARHPATVPQEYGSRCGNINSLKRDEVFTLAPGQSKDLPDWVGNPRFPEPGTYSVVFYYANDPERKWRGVPLGQHDPEAMKRVQKSYPCLLVSNELKLRVRAKE
jgi:hypothetical protein